jgi:hypothetical protein
MFEKSVFLSDIHVPFHDPVAIKVVLGFMAWFKPHRTFLVGDIVDFCQISKFDKNPTRLLKLQEDIDETNLLIRKIVEVGGRVTYITGNHEMRLMRYLWQHPEIANLRDLAIPHLLGLDELGVEFWGENAPYSFHDFLIEHGDIARKHSGYTARGMMEKRSTSGLSGHSHRLASHYYTCHGGDFVWFENGCLCDRRPEYLFGAPNWQQGFSIGWFRGDRFTIEPL